MKIKVKGARWMGRGIAACFYYIDGVENSLRKVTVRGNEKHTALGVAIQIAQGLREGKTFLMDGGKKVDLLGDQFLYTSKKIVYMEKVKARKAKKVVVTETKKQAAKKPDSKVLVLS